MKGELTLLRMLSICLLMMFPILSMSTSSFPAARPDSTSSTLHTQSTILACETTNIRLQPYPANITLLSTYNVHTMYMYNVPESVNGSID